MSNFFKQTLASLLGTLLGLFLFAGAGTTGLLLLLFAAASSSNTSPVVKDKSVVVLDLSMNITDREPSAGEELQNRFSGVTQERMTLRNVIDSLEKAQRDKRIVAIYLDGSRGGNNLGFASLKEIRKALEEFRKSGKKVIAYGVSWNEREYYLSSVADTIALNPLGGLEINGLSSQPMFVAGALQKYGIGVQVVRAGKFKGAVEPFVLNKLSPENREQTQKLLDDVWGEWRTTVGNSRKINPQKLQAIADNQSLLEPTEAKTNGLVDQVAYNDQVVADLKKLTGSDKKDNTFTQISLRRYAQVPGQSLGVARNSKNKIAVVYAEGDIVDGKGDDGQIGGDRFARIFNKIRQDENVKAVVLRINSPGGSATASEVMQREIRLTRESKPVVVSMGDYAASGGYWIATDSNRIFAEPNTITGSIGVFGVLFNGQKLANDNGITWDAVKTARYADSQTVARPKSPQEIAIYQRSVDRIYNMFVNKVAQGRKLPTQKVAQIAQGRVWSGVTAKQIGLVDEIGGLNAAIEYAAKAAKLGKDWQLREYPRESSFEERFFGGVVEEISTTLGIEKLDVKPNDPLTVQIRKIQQEISVLQTMNDPQGVYARLPVNLKIE
ncbi:Peptidase S49, protease IV [Trichormus variabilis ATCC 29413]|uniref:Protease 4 n=2 Tax=Anabaena variabilis TaxID=264691 RepID=Q3MAA9_TRIV2|nr:MULTISPECIES: signal peptide peptidase SppA [Nostocaceae]ABA22077.1 Peptidase S49, protease IV [Trichormus variabilis ATCC 29413]MBC1216834.1 signal peptide peptidase SppA [Trichormus variabilis ARAD]MBC1258065.1 signal peptide peptidase SppA [Trichormus variabilis V5]MBC1269645.1 signal peptide peptidase SppA [Trichormus variabilis FSR]MBC1304031.1 signal peptide peptidase SppA [Trichormus variabilis N2B]